MAGLVLLSCGVYAWRFNAFQVGTYTDDAEYIVLSESLVGGPRSGLINGPGEVQPTRYPLGRSLLLAPVAAAWDGDLQALKGVALGGARGGAVRLVTHGNRARRVGNV